MFTPSESVMQLRAAAELVAKQANEIADLKQQLHAYREYHDAREELRRVSIDRDDREQYKRFEKANAELQLLRGK